MRHLFIFILSIMLAVQVQAQRRLHGQQGIQATVGPVDGFGKKSIHTGVALSRFTKNSNQWIFGVEYLRKKLPYREQLIPVEQFTGQGGYALTFLSDRSKTFFFSVGASAIAGYELVNHGQSLLHDGATLLNESRFLVGGAISFEVESYIVDNVILLLNARERILPGSSVGRFHFQLGIGIKFIIN